MAEPQRFRKKPVEIEAMQWVRTEDCLDAIAEWTDRVLETREDGSPCKVVNQFLILLEGWDDLAIDVLGDDGPRGVRERRADGWDAVVYDDLHGTWVNVRKDDWIIKGIQGEFYPCRPDVFAETYEAVSDR